MKLSVNALPFWERERGDGPLTRLLKLRQKTAEQMAGRMRKAGNEPQYSLAPGCSQKRVDYSVAFFEER